MVMHDRMLMNGGDFRTLPWTLSHSVSRAPNNSVVPAGMDVKRNIFGPLNSSDPRGVSVLQQADNNTNAALDLLSDPAQVETLQLAVVKSTEDAAANAAAAQQLCSMGYRYAGSDTMAQIPAIHASSPSPACALTACCTIFDTDLAYKWKHS